MNQNARGRPATIQIGDEFGRLTVLHHDTEPGARYRSYKCRCSCGTEKTVRGTNLTTGNTTSCGCAQRKSAGSKWS